MQQRKKANRNSSCCYNCYNFIGNLNKIIQIAAINTHIEFKGWWVTSHKTYCGISLLQRINLHKSFASKGRLALCSAKIISTGKARPLNENAINSKHCLLVYFIHMNTQRLDVLHSHPPQLKVGFCFFCMSALHSGEGTLSCIAEKWVWFTLTEIPLLLDVRGTIPSCLFFRSG